MFPTIFRIQFSIKISKITGTNSTQEQPQEEQEAYFFLVVFFFVVVLALDVLAVAGFFTFLAVVFFAVVFFFLAAAAFFLAGAAFLTGFFALGLAVMAFLASADILYEALTFTRSPSAPPLARAAFITCFLI